MDAGSAGTDEAVCEGSALEVLERLAGDDRDADLDVGRARDMQGVLERLREEQDMERELLGQSQAGAAGAGAGRVAELGEEVDEEEEEEEEEEDDDDSVATSDLSSNEDWVTWYCSLKGHEFFCEVDPGYIDDSFNLHGLADKVSFFSEAIDVLLDLEDDLADAFPPDSDERQDLDASAEMLYGLIHARYILTSHGLEAMRDKFIEKEFGECIRIQCERQSLLPLGLSDTPGEITVKTFCCRCQNIYLPLKDRHRGLDGAFWGTTFAHLFLMTFPQPPPEMTHPPVAPTVFGFRIHKSSPYWTPVRDEVDFEALQDAVPLAEAYSPSQTNEEGKTGAEVVGVDCNGSLQAGAEAAHADAMEADDAAAEAAARTEEEEEEEEAVAGDDNGAMPLAAPASPPLAAPTLAMESLSLRDEADSASAGASASALNK